MPEAEFPNAARKPELWLASYPRSGNTYCRIILNTCFDLPVASIYNEAAFEMDAKLAPLVGMQQQHQLGITKTHETGRNDGVPAIYLVRDGRAATVSFLHYQRAHGFETTLEDIILGRVFVGGWSQHYLSWQPSVRPQTEVLTYETLTGDIDTAIETLAGFLNRRPKRKMVHSFDALHRGNPDFFRVGSNAKNIAELSTADLALFDQYHATVMTALGYYRRPSAIERAWARLKSSLGA